MYTMRLNKSDKTISLRRVTKKLNLTRIGRRGIQGPKGDKGDSGEASNLVTSVNGKQGVVVLNKTDIGLSNVDNTSDLSKPISTATQTALDLKANLASLALVATSGSYNDLSDKPTIPDTSNLVPNTRTVNGHPLSSDVTITKSDVGLSNVDNTSDANKPVSSSTQTALNAKANESEVIKIGGQSSSGTLSFGTTNASGVHLLVNNNPLIRVTPIGNVGINVGSEPEVPFLVGGGLFTQAGPVFAEINPDSGVDLSIGTTTNHPVSLVTNNATRLTLATDGTITSAGALNMSNNKVTSVANGTEAQDAVNKQQLDIKLEAPAGFDGGTVLGKNFGGTYSPVPYSQDTEGFNLVMRDIDGQIPGVTPTDATDLANKAYVDSAAAAGTPDATTSVKGKVQLAGDLGGTSALPTIKRTVKLTVSRDSNRLADYMCDGTNDDVQIQAAVTAAGNGEVEVLSSTNPYRVSATIVVPENVTLRGERMARQSAGGVTFKTAASVNLTDMIQVTGTPNPSSNADLKHDVVFENITFDGNNTTTNLVKLTNQDTVKFQNCRLIQSVNSVVTVWNSSSDPVAATIPGGLYMNWCNVSSTGGTAIDLQFQTQCWISNCWFTGSSVDTWINFHASNKIHVVNNEFNAATQALKFSDTATITCNDITVENNVFALNSGQKVITDTRTNAGSTRVTVSGTAATGVIYDKLVGGGNRVLLNDNQIPFNVLSQAAADKLLTLKGFTSQSGRYIEVQNSSATPIAYMNSGGNWYVNNGSTSAVSYGFTSEINSGMYRIGASNLGFSLGGTKYLDLSTSAATFTADVVVPDEAYDATAWNGSLEVPTKNAVRDKIEAMSANAGITRTVVVTSGNVTAGSTASTDYVYLIAGAHTVTLPTAVGNTNRYTLKNNHSANVSLAFTSSQTADGGGITLAPSESVDLISNNTNWSII